MLFDGLVVNCLFIPHEEADEALRETDGLLALTEDRHAEGDLGETVMAALTEAGELVGVVRVAARGERPSWTTRGMVGRRAAGAYFWMMTGVPMTTRLKSCTASQLNMRMQPCDA